jgi:hypothetical protein
VRKLDGHTAIPVLRAPLGDDDQVITLTTEEHAQLALVIANVADARTMRIVHRDGSPWIELDVAVGPEMAEPFPPVGHYAVHRFALWRYTLAVYAIGADGAVDDDPLPWARGRREA